MQIHVESQTDVSGAVRLERIRLGERLVEAVENIEQWQDDDYRYAKMRGSDDNVYVLRFDEAQDAWELAMFQRPRSGCALVPLGPSGRRKKDAARLIRDG